MTKVRKWSEDQRKKFIATMASKREAPKPKRKPRIVFVWKNGRLQKLRLHNIQVYIPEASGE